MDRREFLASSAALAGVSLTALAQPFAAGAFPSQTKTPRRVALIGAGWYGKIDLFRLIQVDDVEVVAICDVDSKMLNEAADITAERQSSRKRPETFKDYRELLKQHKPDIALIGTPDHWHALPMIAAMEAGSDVYVQKPTGIDVLESKAMLDAARRLNKIVQVGTQRRSTPHLAEARDQILREGKLGKIGLIEIYCYYHMRASENPPDAPPPANLDYEMWVGPAPMMPYNALIHPRRWRAYMEYGNGIVGDMCVHMLDCVRWMLDLGWPTAISSVGGIYIDKKSRANITDTQSATFHYPDFDVVWQHRSWGSSPDPKYPWGMTFYGDRGTLKASVMGYDYIPHRGEAVHKDVTYEKDQYPIDTTEKDIEIHVAPAVRYHMKDFLKAVDARSRPVADIEQGHISSASCIMANLSQKLGRSITFDPATHTIPGDGEANSLLKRPYRAPWQHPAG